MENTTALNMIRHEKLFHTPQCKNYKHACSTRVSAVVPALALELLCQIREPIYN